MRLGKRSVAPNEAPPQQQGKKELCCWLKREKRINVIGALKGKKPFQDGTGAALLNTSGGSRRVASRASIAGLWNKD